MDKFDRAILEALQHDATLPVSEIANRIGLTATPCWRRIQRLEQDGYILRRVALLDPQRLNVGTTVFVSVRTQHHDRVWLDRFHRIIAALPEVVELHRMAGHADYLLRVVVPDIAAYDRVYKRLISEMELSDVSSSFSMEAIKSTTELPMSYINP